MFINYNLTRYIIDRGSVSENSTDNASLFRCKDNKSERRSKIYLTLEAKTSIKALVMSIILDSFYAAS